VHFGLDYEDPDHFAVPDLHQTSPAS